MQPAQPKRGWKLLSLVLLLLCTVATAQADTLAAFGDSYSDNGRSQALVNQAALLNVQGAEPVTPASQGYYRHRWSNGPTAVEILANRTGMTLDDMAVGGALTGASNYYPWFDIITPSGLIAQITDYLRLNEQPPRNAFVFASANDFFFRVLDQRADPDRIADAAARNVKLALERLIDAGAKRIMAVGAFDLTLLPRVHHDEAIPAARIYMRAFNDQLRDIVAQMNQRDGVSVSYFDTRAALTDIRHDAVSLGFEDLDHPCLDEESGNVCANPDAHLLWDAYHPTRIVHRLLGEHMARQARRELGW